jgi:hypothetical protein
MPFAVWNGVVFALTAYARIAAARWVRGKSTRAGQSPLGIRLRTGENDYDPAYHVDTFGVRVEDGQILVRVP